jgi:GNAT superfamily N-acetyltransferase
MSAGKGFGSQTLEFVIQRLKSLGFQQISLWVFESNEVARNLYVGKGFQVTDLKRTDDRWKIPEIQMIKKVAN